MPDTETDSGIGRTRAAVEVAARGVVVLALVQLPGAALESALRHGPTGNLIFARAAALLAIWSWTPRRPARARACS